jgi:hypothetical protein
MTEAAKRYLELLNEMEWHRATTGLTRPDELDFAARLDRIWLKLGEIEREAIEQELRARNQSRPHLPGRDRS